MTTVAPLNRSALMALYLSMMAIGMGQTVVFAVLPMLGKEMGLHELVFTIPFTELSFQPGELTITSLSALTAFIFFIVTPIWGRHSDKVGRKPVIVMGLLGYTLGTLLFNGVAEFGLRGALSGVALYFMLAATRLVHASLMSATHPAVSAYIVDVTSVTNRAAGISKVQVFNQLGVMLGPPLAWLATISFLAPLYLQALLTFAIAVMVMVYLPKPPVQAAAKVGAPRLRASDSRVALFVLIGFASYVLLAMVQQTLGFYFQFVLGTDAVRTTQLFSLAMMLSSVAMIAAQLIVVQRLGITPLNLLRMGLPMSFSGYLILAYATNLPTLLLGMVFFGLGMGLAGPGYGALATLSVESHEQGSLAGILAAAAGLGFVVGPLVGGWLYSVDPHYPYWASASLMVPLALLVWRIRPETKAG